MAHLLRKTRQAQASLNLQEIIEEPIVIEKPKAIRPIQERPKPITPIPIATLKEDPFVNPQASPPKTNFLHTPIKEEFSLEKVKSTHLRIREKISQLCQESEELPPPMLTFRDFFKLKAHFLKSKTEILRSKVADNSIRIEKLLSERGTIKSLIMTTMGSPQSYSYIQRLTNLEEQIEVLENKRFKAEHLAFSIANFVDFGELCSSFEECNKVAEAFLAENSIFLDSPECPFIYLSTLFDFLEQEMKEELHSK